MADNTDEKPSLWTGVAASGLSMAEMFFESGPGKKQYELTHINRRDASVAVVREEGEINGALTTMSAVKEAGKLDGMKDIGLFDKQSGEFKSMSAGEPISNDSIRRVSIMVGKQTRYFSQIAHDDGTGNKTGMKATAWVETDKEGHTLKNKEGKCEVRLCFDGFDGTRHEVNSLLTLDDGKLNPQAVDAAAFTDRVINSPEIGGRSGISGIVFGAYSLGASNALASQVVCDLEGVKTRTMVLLEPGGASLAAQKITEAMKNGDAVSSAFTAQLKDTLERRGIASSEGAASMLQSEADRFQQDVSQAKSLRVANFGEDGKVTGSQVANLVPQDQKNVKFSGEATIVGPLINIKRDISNWLGFSNTDILTPPKNNDMVGEKYVVDITGDASPKNLSGLTKIDPYHALSSVLQGLDNDTLLQVHEVKNVMANATVAQNDGTQYQGGLTQASRKSRSL